MNKVDFECIINNILPNFNQNSTIKAIATYLLLNLPELSYEQMVTAVHLIRNKFGLQCETSSSCIGWYKRDMKIKARKDALINAFIVHLDFLKQEEKNNILLKLALAHEDILIKAADVEDIEKYLAITDLPEKIPTKNQIKALKEEAGTPEIIAKAKVPKIANKLKAKKKKIK